MNALKEPDPVSKAKLEQAIAIVQKHFSEGLTELCDPHFLEMRYSEFLHRDDPIYVELLKGMEDEELSKTFVSYWTIAQTLATKSRFWLEDAVAEIITSQVTTFKRQTTHVYSQRMLANGYYEREIPIANLGEVELEKLIDRRPWRPLMKEDALREVDVLVGEQERERIDRKQRQNPMQRRIWDQTQNVEAIENDQQQLKRIAKSVGGRAISDVAIQCNLLAIEPDRKDGKPHVYAFRFINPKTISSHAQRKQERVNLLRLYAYLVQEKPFRDAESIHVSVAELLPRSGGGFEESDHYSDYFSSHTYWNSNQLWDFIGVPFSAVSVAISRVAIEFRDQLKEGLKYLLPGSKPPFGWGVKKKRKKQ